jgi:hypothetical protein
MEVEETKKNIDSDDDGDDVVVVIPDNKKRKRATPLSKTNNGGIKVLKQLPLTFPDSATTKKTKIQKVQPDQPILFATLYTVGTISLPSDDLDEDIHGGIPCLVMTPTTGAALYCVEMDCASSLFASPLYEHQLCLVQSGRKLNENAKKILNSFTAVRLYEVKEWKSWTCRIEDGHTLTTLPKKMVNILQRTFFIQQYRSHQDSNVFREIYFPKFDAYSQPFSSLTVAGLTSYGDDYVNAKTLKGKNVPQQNYFWKNVVTKEGADIAHAINRLFAYEKKGSHYTTITDIASLLMKWKEYSSITKYIAHKITDIPIIFKIHTALKDDENPDIVLKDCATFQLFECSITRTTSVNDVSIFIQKLWDILDSDTDETKIIEANQFQSYGKLIDSLYRLNGIPQVLELMFKYSRDRQGRYKIMRRNIVSNFILPLLLYKLEKTAIINTLSNKSTVDCIRLRIIYGICKYLFRVPCDLKEFSLLQCDDTEPVGDHKLFDFDSYDFNFIITSFYHCVISNYYQKFSNKYQWRYKENNESIITDPNTVLFYIDVHPLLIGIEQKISTFYQKYIVDTSLDVRIYDSPDIDDDNVNNLFDSDNSEEQQYRIILFTPDELKKSSDIQMMKNMTLDNEFYNTSIIREGSTNHFFLSRLASPFFEEIGEQNWYQELYFETIHFQNMTQSAARKKVIITDCHLLTGEDLLNMLKWLTHYKSSIKQIILIGSVHILPFVQNGQPFLDLLLQINSPQVHGLIGKKEYAANEFKYLIESHWTQMMWTKKNEETKREKQLEKFEHLTSSSSSLLFHMNDVETMIDFFKHAYPQKHILVIHLYDEKHKIDFQLPKKSLIQVTDLKIDNLLNYKRSIIRENEEFFLIPYSIIKQMYKNQLNLIFSTLPRLIIVGKQQDKNENGSNNEYLGDILGEIVDIFSSDPRPNMRYTYSSTLCSTS